MSQLKSPVAHPVYRASGNAADLETSLAELMAMQEKDLVKLVPEVNGFTYCGCPSCSGGCLEWDIIVWNGPKDPDHVHCQYCKMVFPNDEYPENQTVEVPDNKGNMHTWRYYKGSQGNQYYFSARARQEAKYYMADRAYDFAAAYALTGKQKYARRAALILQRFSEVYPMYNLMQQYPALGQKYPVDPAEAKARPPRWTEGIWGFWIYNCVPVPLIKAYDLIYDSGELEKTGWQVKERLEKEVFRASVSLVRSFPDNHSNAMPITYTGIIVAGRVLVEPEYVHYAVGQLLHLFKTQFFFDGMWKEGTISYHHMVMNGLNSALEAVKGYSDPPEYKPPKHGSRLDNIDLAQDIPFIARLKVAPLCLVFPSGYIVATHDAWSLDKGSIEYATGPMLLAGMGHGRLGCGEDSNIMQTHLHFSGSYGHDHRDSLSFILFAKGQELLSDIGYTNTGMRHVWASATASHNTVAVDGQNHGGRQGGCLQLYSPGAGFVQAIEATQLESHPGLEKFRRRLVQVQVSPADAYVVDIFNVRGGKQHAYFLHGSADLPQTAEVSLPLKETTGTLLGPGAEFVLPKASTDPGRAPEGKLLSYALFRNLRETTTDDSFNITWRFKEGVPTCLRSTIIGQPDCRVILADTPQVRPAKENEGQVLDYWRPSLVVQRQGTGKLSSTFVAIHEPFIGEPFISSVKPLLATAPTQTGSPVALAIEHIAGTDYVISCPRLDQVAVEVQGGLNLTFRGRLAVVRARNGEVVFVYLYDGEELSLGDFSLNCPPSPTGEILSVHRDEKQGQYSFLATGRIPPGDLLHGFTVIVTHPDKTTHGYLIQAVEPRGENSLIRLQNEPGFEIAGEKTCFLFYPQHELEGTNIYRIDNAVIVARGKQEYSLRSNCEAEIKT